MNPKRILIVDDDQDIVDSITIMLESEGYEVVAAQSGEEGMKLVGFCSKKLEEAEQKVTMLVKESEGQYVQQSFEAEDRDDN